MIDLLNCGLFSYPKDAERGNQDAILPPKSWGNGYIVAVADGVGSYSGAREAADIAIATLTELDHTNHLDMFMILKTVKLGIEGLVSKSYDLAKAATTLSFCIIDEHSLRVCHVGDTRVYVRKGNKLIQLTKDHTQHQELIDEGIYTKNELRNLSGKNVLTSALSRSIEPRFQEVSLPTSELVDENGVIDIYIMSDGAHHFWEKRARFSLGTLSMPTRFSSSLLRRIENGPPIDDYSLVSASFSIK